MISLVVSLVCRSFVIQQIPSSNLFMVVVDNKCECSSAAVTMDPIEIMYILSQWNTCMLCFCAKDIYLLELCRDAFSYWLQSNGRVNFDFAPLKSLLSYEAKWVILKRVEPVNLETHLLLFRFYPWPLWTQRVTKMWQAEVSEGQEEAWIMSPLPPWGMKILFLHNVTL